MAPVFGTNEIAGTLAACYCGVHAAVFHINIARIRVLCSIAEPYLGNFHHPFSHGYPHRILKGSNCISEAAGKQRESHRDSSAVVADRNGLFFPTLRTLRRSSELEVLVTKLQFKNKPLHAHTHYLC